MLRLTPILALMVLTVPLSACAMSDIDPPSLAKRPIEDVDFDSPVAVAAPDRVDSLPPQLAGTVEEAVAKSDKAHAKFLRDLPAVRRSVAAGRGAARESEGWTVAQIALAGLEVTRAPSSDALADLDRIYIERADAEMGDAPVGAAAIIGEARAKIERQVAEQMTALDSLRAGLR